ncbi:MAG: orotidine-5'-phosphate decarboxylase [Chloroflexia bacterium]|nr:orotidine-5'-phosphate decarboxylase [Chloroflexia bacterium]
MKRKENLGDWFRRQESLLCVGLDPLPERLPQAVRDAADPVLTFNQAIVEATAPWAAAYKPNLAFYEALGPSGLETLRQTIAFIHQYCPALVIVDAKRADIGHSSAAYARAILDQLGADAVTLNPYLGRQALEPFLERADRGCFILCRTSNPGAGEFQDLSVAGRPLYQVVAERVATWNERGNCGLVVGATYPQELSQVRRLCPDLPLLIPGVGAQGGSLQQAVSEGLDRGGGGILINSSRGILYASAESDFAESSARAARQVHDAIEQARSQRSVDT